MQFSGKFNSSPVTCANLFHKPRLRQCVYWPDNLPDSLSLPASHPCQTVPHTVSIRLSVQLVPGLFTVVDMVLLVIYLSVCHPVTLLFCSFDMFSLADCFSPIMSERQRHVVVVPPERIAKNSWRHRHPSLICFFSPVSTLLQAFREPSQIRNMHTGLRVPNNFHEALLLLFVLVGK